jgi:AraC-like DNA-binding protein
MNPFNQLGYHVFHSMHMNVIIYQGDAVISEYLMPVNLVELEQYIHELMNDFYASTKTVSKDIIIQKYQESECVLASLKHNDLHMIMGPFLDNNHQIQTVNQMKLKLKIGADHSSTLNQFYENLQMISPNDLRFIHKMLSTYEGYDLNSKIHSLKPVSSNHNPTLPQENINEIRLYVKNNYAFEEKLMKGVESGDSEGLKSILNSLSTFYLPDRLPRDTLRNTKNKMIILNSISTRAAIKGGLDIYHAHEISTKLGMEIEQMKSHHDQDRISLHIVSTFADAVRDFKTEQYPDLVRQTYLYIYRNLKEPFSVRDIADALYVTKEHLSRTFKKATQQTIQDAIMGYKIMEAKKLIEQNELSLIDISDMLCFSSSSHFSTAFKLKVGISPKDYKKQFNTQPKF